MAPFISGDLIRQVKFMAQYLNNKHLPRKAQAAAKADAIGTLNSNGAAIAARVGHIDTIGIDPRFG